MSYLTEEQLRQALKKLENDTSHKTTSEETYQKLLKLSPKERAELALKKVEERGHF